MHLQLLMIVSYELRDMREILWLKDDLETAAWGPT
jgi:hypothetical protein